MHVAEVLGPYRLKVTVPVGVPVDTTSVFTAALSIVLAATVAVSHTDVPGGPPELGTVVVVVGVGTTHFAMMIGSAPHADFVGESPGKPSRYTTTHCHVVGVVVIGMPTVVD